MNMVYNGYPVTNEQQECIDWACMHGSQKIEAFAGAGKTTTLGAISEALFNLGKRGLYIAFNKSIADEANTKMPSNVTARTAHSLAYREKAIPFQQRGKLGKCFPNVIARELRISRIEPMTPVGVAGLALKAVTNFCYSADTQIGLHHVSVNDFFKAGIRGTDLTVISETILTYAKRLWLRMLDLNDRMPITHDVYMKLWCLDNPMLNYDFILFDEAQDANPVLVDLVMKQRGTTIFVGDRYQQIYSWRGATNAMQKMQMQCNRLTQSFRFGQPIADVANEVLRTQLNADVNIRGFDKIKSEIIKLDSFDCLITRTNSSLIGRCFSALDDGARVHVNGGTSQLLSLIRGLKQLREGQRTEHPELNIFENWQQVMEYSETDQGQELKMPLRLIDDYGIDDLIGTIEQVGRVPANRADYTLTTAHKSKGLEWSRVKLDSDFREKPEDPDEPGNSLWSPEEANLLYVAATRAENALDASLVDDLGHLYQPKQQEVAA